MPKIRPSRNKVLAEMRLPADSCFCVALGNDPAVSESSVVVNFLKTGVDIP
jgi:hypothetical protein